MKYITIDAEKEQLEVIDAVDLETALAKVGLKYLGVDWVTVCHSPNIVLEVDEWGLRKPMDHFFTINKHMYAGNGVLFAADAYGESMDTPYLDKLPFTVKFYHSAEATNEAIKRGEVVRPSLSFNGKKLWEWSPFVEDEK